MATSLTLQGLYVPLVTPMLHGGFDAESMKKLMMSMEEIVQGYVPCLSSGEGASLSASQWEEVVSCVVQNTEKPVIAGILNNSMEETISRAHKASELRCEAVIVPIPKGSDAEIVKYFQALTSKIELPIVLYNSEHSPLESAPCIQELDKIEGIAGIKDSSKNLSFFKKLVELKSKGNLHLAVLQGMENQLYESVGCDGFLISLLNVEPDLCANMLQNPSKELNDKILNLFSKYNLGADNWYVSLKALLHARGIIRSSEQIEA